MKKLAILAAAALMLALAAVAYGQVVNSYDVDGSTSPTRAGTKTKGVPVGVKFGFAVSAPNNQRPAVNQKYSIRLGGIVVNTNAFPKCSASTLENQGPKGCPAGAKIGSGFIKNATGSTSDQNDQSVVCNAELTVWNSGDNRGALYVAGSPNQTDPRKKCAIELAAPIPAQFIRRSGATALEFTVPQSLRHPLPTLSNAVKDIDSSLPRKTTKRNGRTVGFFESRGGCVRGKRTITVVFTPEQGAAQTAQHLARCTA